MKAENLAGTDDLTGYTPLHRANYLLESSYLIETLPRSASVLQVGSMDGARAISLLQARPDLAFTGLDIEPSLTEVANLNAKTCGVQATFITGDILAPPTLPAFDVVLCLNNTLSYIEQPLAAVSNMRALGNKAIVSVFTEAFDVDEARSYYQTLGLSLERVDKDAFVMSDGWRIHRFASADVASWVGTNVQTPLGELVQLPA